MGGSGDAATGRYAGLQVTLITPNSTLPPIDKDMGRQVRGGRDFSRCIVCGWGFVLKVWGEEMIQGSMAEILQRVNLAIVCKQTRNSFKESPLTCDALERGPSPNPNMTTLKPLGLRAGLGF